MWTSLIESGVLQDWAGRGFRILAVLLVLWVALRLLRSWTERVREQWLATQLRVRRLRKDGGDAEKCEELEKRSLTIAHSVRHALTIVVVFIGLVTIADLAGFETKALLGAAGIASIAVGFGARSLVQDVVNGLFLLGGNQVREGDLVRLGGQTGIVEEINLRRVRLRSGDGTVHLIANGSIQHVANLSFGFSCYVWDLRLSYHEDVDRVIAVLQEIGRELRESPEHQADILEDLEIFGVDGFGPHGATLKMRFKTMPRRHAAVGRAMNRLIKKRFDELGIAFPLPARRLYPVAAPVIDFENLPGRAEREQLKAEIRELLAGMSDHPVLRKQTAG
jgi:moderate conductance mechanosensitive channel